MTTIIQGADVCWDYIRRPYSLSLQ